MIDVSDISQRKGATELSVTRSESENTITNVMIAQSSHMISYHEIRTFVHH